MGILDDQKLISEIDKSNMIESISKLPEQIKEAKDIVKSSSIGSLYKIDNILISGMGASSISGDIINSLLLDKLDIPIIVSRKYELPKWVNKNTLIISQSYSGNTEETLSTFKHAYQKRCKIIGISSGGKLEDFCKKREVPHIKIPEGYAPRAAIGYSLFSALYSLEKIGIIKFDLISDIDDTINILYEFRKKNNIDINEKDNLSKQLANKIFNSIPQIYGFGFYDSIIKRWCTQFNENSKLICKYNDVPECNHNDIVGWSMNPEISKKFTCILFRDSELESIYITKRLDFMKNIFKEVSKEVIEVHPKGKKRLAKMMYMLFLGDYISYYIAILRKVDPTPVIAIQELKNELSKL